MAVVVGRHRSGGGEDAGRGDRLITTLSSSGLDGVDDDEGGQGRRRRRKNADDDAGRRRDVVVENDAPPTATRG
jgi:hypothetical protein